MEAPAAKGRPRGLRLEAPSGLITEALSPAEGGRRGGGGLGWAGLHRPRPGGDMWSRRPREPERALRETGPPGFSRGEAQRRAGTGV